MCRSRSPGLLNRGPGGAASLGHVLIPASSNNWSGLQNLSHLQLKRGPEGPFLPGGGFPYHTFSPTNRLPVFTELYNSSIAHSIFGMACLIVIKRK